MGGPGGARVALAYTGGLPKIFHKRWEKAKTLTVSTQLNPDFLPARRRRISGDDHGRLDPLMEGGHLINLKRSCDRWTRKPLEEVEGHGSPSCFPIPSLLPPSSSQVFSFSLAFWLLIFAIFSIKSLYPLCYYLTQLHLLLLFSKMAGAIEVYPHFLFVMFFF